MNDELKRVITLRVILRMRVSLFTQPSRCASRLDTDVTWPTPLQDSELEMESDSDGRAALIRWRMGLVSKCSSDLDPVRQPSPVC